MSCCLPVIVKPVFLDDKCYVDGGIICNYPLKYCLDSGKKETEILGFKNISISDDNVIVDESNLLNYTINFIFKLVQKLNMNNSAPVCSHELIFKGGLMTYNIIHKCAMDMNFRKELYNEGVTGANNYIEKL